jgi:hypothetical protein
MIARTTTMPQANAFMSLARSRSEISMIYRLHGDDVRNCERLLSIWSAQS